MDIDQIDIDNSMDTMSNNTVSNGGGRVDDRKGSFSKTSPTSVKDFEDSRSSTPAAPSAAASTSVFAPQTKKKRKPANYAFTQQRLRAWQPILRPKYVVISFLILTAIFIPFGIALLMASKSVIQYEIPYTYSCKMVRNETLGWAPYCEAVIEFNITKTIKPPSYLYYKLENFYQNHRRYASSRYDKQLEGQADATYAEVQSSCTPIISYAGKNTSNFYDPCGLIAWSMFNDTFTITTLNKSDNSAVIVCDTKSQIGCTKQGIAWKSDRTVKFRPPNTPVENRMYNLTYYNESTHVIPDILDEDLMVWMRTAALPNFRKLHRIINQELNPGKYYLHVVQNFPVTQFGGKKSIVISTTSWIGGKNDFLAICYLVVGSICFSLAVVFAVGMLIQKIFNSTSSTA
jgi:hypothetical protein